MQVGTGCARNFCGAARHGWSAWICRRACWPGRARKAYDELIEQLAAWLAGRSQEFDLIVSADKLLLRRA